MRAIRNLFFLLPILLVCLHINAQDSTSLYVDTAHTPKKSTILSAVLPGTGQIYNQIYKIEGQKNTLWWKLPLVYGSLGAATYLAIFNQQQFKKFKTERLNRLDDTFISSNLSNFSNAQLKVYQDQYDRWRNLSIIGGLGVYLLQLIDANVEGHLMHFDTSDDLSINWMPIAIPQGNNMSFGVSLRFSFQ